MYLPFSEEKIDIIASKYAPNTRKLKSLTFDYWVRTLFQRAQSAITIDLIDEWEDDKKDVFFYWLFKYGYVGVINTEEYGYIFQYGTPYGFDIYRRPAEFVIANAKLPSNIVNAHYKIGENCAIIKLTPDYMGIWDVIEFYASKLASIDNAIDISIENSKIPMILGARNKAAAAFLKKVLDKVHKGESAVIVDETITNDRTDKAEPFQLFDRQTVKNGYITSMQLADVNTILKQFDSQVGIPSIDNKGERMYTVEAMARTVDSSSRAITWVNTLNNSFKSVKETFPDMKEMRAYLTFNIPEGGDENVDVNADSDRE